MFEKIVVSLLNRIFGNYFEIIDPSHLNLSFWRGDVALTDILIKNTAFDVLKLPFQVVFGNVGKLTMNIPWKAIYTSPLEATLKDLFVVAIPTSGVPYNAEAEEHAALTLKMKLLSDIEEVRHTMQLREMGEVVVEGDTYSEKFLMLAIRNLHVRIESIHIRYEDSVTSPRNPFIVGVVLKYLNVQTTDSTWAPNSTVPPAAPTIYKIARMEGLAVYLNSGEGSMVSQQELTKEEILKTLKTMIASENVLKFMVGPVMMELKVQLTRSPENGHPPFMMPKVKIEMVMDELSIGISNLQFNDIIHFVDAINSMTQSKIWRKLRPNVSGYRENMRVWWKFAFTCVLEEIRLKHKSWTWSQIKSHRTLYKAYYNASYKKHILKTTSQELENQIKQYEFDLDNFNIVLVRKQIEMKKERQDKIENQRKRQAGWLGSLLGWNAEENLENAVRQFDEGWNDEERKKLNLAMGYTGNSLPVDSPREYVEFKFNFYLKKVNVIVIEIHSGPSSTQSILLRLKLDNFINKLQYRPVNNGLKVEWKMGDIEVYGVPNAKQMSTCIVKAKKDMSEHFFEVCYETSPLESSAEKIIQLRSKALEVVYHAKTIFQVFKCFTPSSEIQLSRIQADAMSRLNYFKEVSAASLRRMVHTKEELIIEIDFVAPYFIIPEKGDLDLRGSTLIIDLGELQVRTQSRDKPLFDSGVLPPSINTSPDENGLSAEFLDLYYETYIVKLKDFRVLLALPDEDFRLAMLEKIRIGEKGKPTHLVSLKDLLLTVNESLLVSNPNAPKFIAKVSLPLADLEITEDRLISLVRLLMSLPLSKRLYETDIQTTYSPEYSRVLATSEMDYVNEENRSDPRQAVQFTDLILDFRLESVKIRISKPQGLIKELKPLLDFEMSQSRAKFCYKTYITTIEFLIGGLTLQSLQHNMPGSYGPLYLVRTPMMLRSENPLLSIRISAVAPNCPKSVLNPIKLQITSDISSVDFILHEEILLVLLTFVDGILCQVFKDFQNIVETPGPTTRSPTNVPGISVMTGESFRNALKINAMEINWDQNGSSGRRNSTKYKGDPMDILIKADIKMESLTIQLSTERKNILRMIFANLDVTFQQNPNNYDLNLQLSEISCINLDLNSSYNKILSVDGDKCLSAHVIVYNGEVNEASTLIQPDLKITVKTGNPRLVCIGTCFNEIITFADHFNSVKKAIKEASKAVGENMKQALGNDPKTLVDINIGAPKIVLPKDSHSPYALMADLGNLSLQNSFRFLDSGQVSRALLDEMHIHLKSVKLSRIYLELETQDIRSESLLMGPVSYLSKLCRNLSADWYTKIPTWKYDGKLDSTVVRISNEDYELALTAFLHFVAGFDEGISRLPNIPTRNTKTEVDLTDEEEEENPKKSNVLTLSVKLTFDEFGIILFKWPSSANEGNSLNSRRNTCLAKISVANTCIGLKMWDKHNIEFNTTVRQIGFSDCRENSVVFPDLIQRVSASEEPILKFDVTFSCSPLGENLCHISFHIEDMRLLVCLDYLAQVVGFFLIPSYTTSNFKSVENGIGIKRISDGINQSLKRLGKESISVDFNSGELELVLVEDMNTLHTNAVMFKFQTVIEMASLSREVFGTVKSNIQVNTCNYSPLYRNATLSEVFSSTDIHLVFVKSKGASSTVEVGISDIFIRLSAGTVELFVNLSKSWNSGSEIAKIEARREVDNSNIWDVKSIDDLDFWFLSPDIPEKYLNADVHDVSGTEMTDNDTTFSERLVVKPFSVVVTFEVGVNLTTTPLLLLDASIDVQAFNWSEKIILSGSVMFSLAYNNSKFGMWEYLVEPIEVGQYGKATHKPWEATFVVSKSNASTRHRTAESIISLPIPTSVAEEQTKVYYVVSFQSIDILELTVTQTALEVLKKLSEAFQDARKSLVSQRQISTSPYVLVNDTGVDVKLDLHDTSFIFTRDDEFCPGEVNMATGTKLNLYLDNFKTRYSILREQEGKIERRIKILIEKFQFEEEIPINRTEGRFYPFEPESRNGFFCDVTMKDCSVVVTFRGVFKVVNHLKVPIGVFSQDEGQSTLKQIGTVASMSYFNIPIVLNRKSDEFFFAPNDHIPEEVSIIWSPSNAPSKIGSNITCKSKSGNCENISVKIINEIRQVLLGNTNRRTFLSRICNIHIRPPLIIFNSLPTVLSFSNLSRCGVNTESRVGGGSLLHVTSLEQNEDGEFDFILKVQNEEHTLSCPVNIKHSTPDLSAWAFRGNDGIVLHLGIQKEISDGVTNLQVYCPFWMINLTGLLLAYKGDTFTPIKQHPADHKEPVMFSSDEADFFSKKKASLKCTSEGDWSEKFYLDVTGSSTQIISKSPRKYFNIEATISLSKFGLTKLITFKPKFQIINRCSYHIILYELEFKDEKILFEGNRCYPFWPRSNITTIATNIYGTNEISRSINYGRIQNTLLKIKNRYGGIHVNVHVSETKSTIIFSEYIHGQSPALLINATDNTSIDLGEIGGDEKINLMPRKCQLFTWFEPAGQRILRWSIPTLKHTEFKDNLLVDSSGQYKGNFTSGVEKEIHWISFLEGFQRIVLFTESQKVAAALTNSRVGELIQMEFILALSGLGISLVDVETCREILYLRISSTGIQWEMSPEGISNLFLPVDLESSTLIENAYQNYIEAKNISNFVDAIFTIDPALEINFAEMMTLKPIDRLVRRSPAQAGIWIDMKKLPLSIQVQARVNRIQIDNQLNHCTFRTLLSPVPPPKSIVTENDSPKPFINMSLLQRSTAHSKVVPFIYCSVLVQEFHVRLDMGFINAVIALFRAPSSSKLNLKMKSFETDYEIASRGSEIYFNRQVLHSGHKYFFEKLHLSPIKVHLSFSVSGSAQETNTFLSLLLQSIGVTLTDAQDVVFKLACLELKHLQFTDDQLAEEIKSHYISQAMRQLYSWILGLDLIGNPISLVTGFTEGIEAFFYEPIQGAIQGPAEFAEGFTLGVKSLFGHTLGGAAGALSKITGSFGKGFAFLTMDDNYQRKRQELIAKRSREGLVGYARNFIKAGIVDTMTGVVTNPIRGAQAEGFSGFGKGLLKGTLGLVARPIVGAADLATGTLSALQRATQPKDAPTQVRPPRNIEPDTSVMPYVRQTAEGNLILKELKFGREDLDQDDYVAHIVVGYTKNQVLLITTHRAFYLTLRDIFGASVIQWKHVWDDLINVPDITEKERGLSFHLKGTENGVGLLRNNRGQKLVVPIPDAQTCFVMSFCLVNFQKLSIF